MILSYTRQLEEADEEKKTSRLHKCIPTLKIKTDDHFSIYFILNHISHQYNDFPSSPRLNTSYTGALGVNVILPTKLEY